MDEHFDKKVSEDKIKNINIDKLKENIIKEEINMSEEFDLNIKLIDFIKEIKENVYEFDKQNRNMEILALITFSQNKHTMDGIVKGDNLSIIKGCSSAIVCNIALLLQVAKDEIEIVYRIINAVERQKNKILELIGMGEEPNYFWHGDRFEKVIVEELIIEIKNNVLEFDRDYSLGKLALIIMKQDGKTMKGILDEDRSQVIIGATNAIICNIAMLNKVMWESKENQQKIEEEVENEIIKHLFRSVNEQKQQVNQYKKGNKFFR